MNRLTDRQRELAGDPANVRFAASVAGKLRRLYPEDPEEILSAAFVGLVAAAGRFDPDKGVTFRTFAAFCIRGAILDHLRTLLPAGYKRTNGADVPYTHSLSNTAFTPGTGAALEPHGCHQPVEFTASVVSDEEPVGWELEALDAVEWMGRQLPPMYGATIRLYYTRAGTTLFDVSAELGVCQSRCSQMLTRGTKLLRKRLATDPTFSEVR